MKFSDYTYLRPNYETYKVDFLKTLQLLTDATELTEAVAAVNHLNELRATIETAYNLASIRYSVDTNDAFYEKEDNFWNEYQPLFQELDFQFYQSLLNSPLLDELKASFPSTLFLFAEGRVKTFSPELIPLFQKENQLSSDYSKLVASAQIPFEGEVYTLSQLTPFAQSVNESTRRQATEKNHGVLCR